MMFNSILLKALADGDPPKGMEIIENRLVGRSRWALRYRLVFKFDEHFYESSYYIGATEQQDQRPYEDDLGMVECPEVVPVQTTVTIYERKL